MKNLGTFLTFAGLVLAQNPFDQARIRIKSRPNGGIVTQELKDRYHRIYDSDGSVLTDIQDNVVSFRSSSGAQRATLGGNGVTFSGDECGVLALKSGSILSETTWLEAHCANGLKLNTLGGDNRIQFQPDVSGVLSQFTMRWSGITAVQFQATSNGGKFLLSGPGGSSGVSAEEDVLSTHVLRFFDSSGTPTGMQLATFGRGATGRLALPSGVGSVGDCFKITSTNQAGWGPCGSPGGVSSVTGSGLISVSPPTGAVVISCPLCAGMTTTNTFTNPNTFSNTVSFSNLITLTSSAVITGNLESNVAFSNSVGSTPKPWGSIYTADLHAYNNIIVGGTTGAIGFVGIDVTCPSGQVLLAPIYISGVLVGHSGCAAN